MYYNFNMTNTRFITVDELTAFLKERGKSRTWLGLIRKRYQLVQKPIILSHKQYIAVVPSQKPRHGKFFLYPREIRSRIEEIIRLHDVENLSYAEIQKKLGVIVAADPRLQSSGEGFRLMMNFAERNLLSGEAGAGIGKAGRALQEAEEALRKRYIAAKDAGKADEAEKAGENLDFVQKAMTLLVRQVDEERRRRKIPQDALFKK
jgi:hypothetical protein